MSVLNLVNLLGGLGRVLLLDLLLAEQLDKVDNGETISQLDLKVSDLLDLALLEDSVDPMGEGLGKEKVAKGARPEIPFAAATNEPVMS